MILFFVILSTLTLSANADCGNFTNGTTRAEADTCKDCAANTYAATNAADCLFHTVCGNQETNETRLTGATRTEAGICNACVNGTYAANETMNCLFNTVCGDHETGETRLTGANRTEAGICNACVNGTYAATATMTCVINCPKLGTKSTTECYCDHILCNNYCILKNNSHTNVEFCSNYDPLSVYVDQKYFPDCVENSTSVENSTETCQCWKSSTQDTFGTLSQCATSSKCEQDFGHCLDKPYCNSKNGAAATVEDCTCNRVDNYRSITNHTTCVPGEYCQASSETKCRTTSLLQCLNIDGTIDNMKEDTITECQCGPTAVCTRSDPYCFQENDLCDESPIVTCVNNVVNHNECKCGTETIQNCDAGQMCSIDGAIGTCSFPFCSNSITCTSSSEHYYNGIIDEAVCTTSECDTPADYTQCCRTCEVGDWDNTHNECSKDCTNKNWECPVNYRQPPPFYRLTIENEHILPKWEYDRLDFPFTDRCNGNCSQTLANVQSCCLTIDKCGSHHASIWDSQKNEMPLCQRQNGYITNESKYGTECQGYTCTPQECCEEKICTCTNGIKALPPTCATNGTEMCTICAVGFWKSGFECKAGSNCTLNQYQTETANGIVDTKCHDLTTCDDMQYILKQSTTTSDRICESLSICDLDLQFISVKKTNFSNRICSDLSVCNYTSEFCSAKPSTYIDRECTVIATACNASAYESQSPNTTHNRVCTLTSPTCNYSTHYQSQAPTLTQNRECQEIQTCQLHQYESQHYTNATNRECTNITQCNNATEYESQMYTTTTNRVCTKLTLCAYSQYQNETATATNDRTCSPLTSCTETQYAEEPASLNANGVPTGDRICTTCAFDGCLGCMDTTDCQYSASAKVHNQSLCSQHKCIFYSYLLADTITFDPGTPVLKNGHWVRLDQNGTQNITLDIGSEQLYRFANYQYFYVPYRVFEASYMLDSNAIPFEVQQDCQYNYIYNESCLVDNRKCVNGSRSGTQKKWFAITHQANGGKECPLNPIIEPCVNYECDRNCISTEGSWSACQDTNGQLTVCGSHGQKRREYYITQEAKYDGTPCPTGPSSITVKHAPFLLEDNITISGQFLTVVSQHSNQTATIVTTDATDIACLGDCGTINNNIEVSSIIITVNKFRSCLQPHPEGDCDCQGRKMDGCGICGGTCCPLGIKRDNCGICGGTNNCALRLSREQRYIEEKHQHSQTMRLFLPSLTFILLTIAFTGFCLCLFKETK